MSDKIIKAMAGGSVRIIACTATGLVNYIKKIHNLNECTSLAFGRLMVASSMISSTNKTSKDSIIIRIDGDGPLKSMSAITRGDGTLKGYISNPNAFTHNFKLNELIGNGVITFTKDLYLKSPYSGQTPLYKGNVCEDISYYYTLSEQTPTAIDVGIEFDNDLNIKNCIGLMVQMMPDATEMIKDIISYRFEDIKSVLTQIEMGKDVYDILNFMFDDLNLKIIEEKELSYKCDCSREKVERALISLNKQELEKIIADNKEESIVCDYCKKEYLFTNSQIKKIYETIFKNH